MRILCVSAELSGLQDVRVRRGPLEGYSRSGRQQPVVRRYAAELFDRQVHQVDESTQQQQPSDVRLCAFY